MAYTTDPDFKRSQRGGEWKPYEHSVAVPVASGQTIYHGDLVEINASGQATRVTGTAGGIPTVTAIYGISVGSSGVVSADSELYPKLQVKQIAPSYLVVLRLLTSGGSPATTAADNIGKSITLRVASSGFGIDGVLGCNIKSGTDPVHGIVVDVIDKQFVLVKLDDDICAGG